MNIPGLKVLCPANVQDMYLMFKEGIEDDNPVLCFADRSLFWLEDDVSVVSQKKIGEARVVREGNDLTIVTISGCLHMVEEILWKRRGELLFVIQQIVRGVLQAR